MMLASLDTGDDGTAECSVQLLGTLQVHHRGTAVIRFGGDKVRAMLAYLAVEADRPHAREAVAGLFWPDLPTNGALRNLTQTLVRLREALGSCEPIVTTRQAVQWRDAAAEVDVATFIRLSASAEPDDLARAAALYRGEFLAGFTVPECETFEEWLLLTRERLQQQALRAPHTLAEHHLPGDMPARPPRPRAGSWNSTRGGRLPIASSCERSRRREIAARPWAPIRAVARCCATISISSPMTRPGFSPAGSRQVTPHPPHRLRRFGSPICRRRSARSLGGRTSLRTWRPVWTPAPGW